MEQQFELAKEYLAKFPNVKVELIDDACDGNPGIIIDGWITIWPEKLFDFQVTLGHSRIFETTYYHVDLTTTSHATRYEPESADIIEVGEFRRFEEAFKAAMVKWLENDLYIFEENKYWQQRYEEEKSCAINS